MDKRTIIRNLRRHHTWVKEQKEETRPGGRTAETVMVACFEVLHECGRSKESEDAWINRFGFRRAFQRIQERYTRPDGKRALRRLIELAISELEACSWKKHFSVGALPVDREPRPPTAAQRAASRRNMGRILARQRQERQQRKMALEARLSGEEAPNTTSRATPAKTCGFPRALEGVQEPFSQSEQLAGLLLVSR